MPCTVCDVYEVSAGILLRQTPLGQSYHNRDLRPYLPDTAEQDDDGVLLHIGTGHFGCAGRPQDKSRGTKRLERMDLASTNMFVGFSA